MLYPTVTAMGDGQLVLIGIAPTLVDRPRRAAPAGRWTITIENTSALSAKVNVWVERDDTVIGYPIRGRQSFLHDPNYERFDQAGRPQTRDQNASVVKRAGSFNGFATGNLPAVTGGWMLSSGETARFSGAGEPVFVSDGAPTALAVADESPVRRGVISAKTRTGGVIALSGTSVAAAQITRWVAEQMATASASDRPAAAAKAAQDEAANPQWPAAEPSERGGAGRIVTTSPTTIRRQR